VSTLIDRLAGAIPLLPQPAAMASPSVVAAAFALAAALSWLVLWALMPLLRRGLLDQPNRRSSHRIATPRGGGLSFVVVASGLSLALGQGKAAWIPVMLTAVALLAMAATPLPPWSLPLTLIAITAVINFVNFMDGLDGLVGLSVLVVMGACGQWLLAGALAGFLLWNWSPAKVFMGDVGSTWLGAVFAGLVLQQPTPLAATSLLLLGVPLLGDALTCVLRRLAAGQAVFQAHRLHLFQRLQRAGWSHRRVALTYGAATGLLALCRQSGSAALLLGAMGCVLLLAWRLEQRVAVPFERAAQES
jgi:UDP-N-acetylmuramyl pentapeptide phosphotransferase/UDP-N-acetylglucosamine-1-phosphate transferase